MDTTTIVVGILSLIASLGAVVWLGRSPARTPDAQAPEEPAQAHPAADLIFRHGVSIVPGWVSYPSTLHSDEFTAILRQGLTSARDWLDDFYADVPLVTSIRARKPSEVMALAKQISDCAFPVERQALMRALSVSSTLYDFKIPTHCVLLDEPALELMAKYVAATVLMDHTELMRVWRLNKSSISPELSEPNRIKRIYALMSYAPAIYHVLGLHVGGRLPNFYNFRMELAARHPKHSSAIVAIDHDELKTVVTVAMVKAGLLVPRDYLAINDFICDHLVRVGSAHQLNTAMVLEDEMANEEEKTNEQ